MINATLSNVELTRVKALESYHIMDTLPEQEFDNITKIAQEICHTSMSLLSFIDADRQWFKSTRGIEVQEVPREKSACSETLQPPYRIRVIDDVRTDARFKDSLVKFPEGVVFYASVPLVNEQGFALGTLCIMDTVARSLTQAQEKTLYALSTQVVNLLELRKKKNELESKQNALRSSNHELELAKERLEIALKDKSEFLSMMSHEIRTPLHAILGNINLLLEESPRADQEIPLNVLKFTGETLLSIINDILDYSKLEAQKVEVERISFHLSDLISNIVEINWHRAKERGNVIKVELDPTIPTYLIGDPTRLVQVINNLVSNAVKFTKKGEISIRCIAQNIEQQKVNVQFEVADTGIGIAPESLDMIFDEFAQASALTTRQFGGTGLGLAIIKKILALFGSEIKVESTLNVGSKFYFTMPFKIAEKIVEETHLLELSFENYRVLAVDDNEINLRIIDRNLTKKGMLVHTFSSPLDALKSVEEGNQYDIAIVDLQMPDLNGFELAKRIWAILPKLPIIASSADNNAETVAISLKTNMNDYLLKPHTAQDLYKVLAKHLIAAMPK